jgi:hypothetical protein
MPFAYQAQHYLWVGGWDVCLLQLPHLKIWLDKGVGEGGGVDC